VGQTGFCLVARATVACRAATENIPAMPSATKPRLSGISVLLVDDDEDDLALLLALLTQAGARVTAVSTVEAALREFEKDRPDVIVSDLVMKGHDGFTLIRRIRRAPEGGGEIPCIAMSAFVGTARQQKQVLAEGFTEFLAKPVHDRIVDTVTGLISPRKSA
jgi:CheY-like chemotaxis protein